MPPPRIMRGRRAEQERHISTRREGSLASKQSCEKQQLQGGSCFSFPVGLCSLAGWARFKHRTKTGASPGGEQLHRPGPFLPCFGWMWLTASAVCLWSTPGLQGCIIHDISPVKQHVLLLSPWYFSSAGKGRVVARTWLLTLKSWYMLIITWLTELRLWEKHQMFMCPEINLWDLAALLLGVPGRGGEGTPRLLLLRISVLKMTRLIQPQIWASHTELPQVPYHSTPRYGGTKPPRWLPADFTWEADLWQSQHTQGKVQGEIGLVGIGIHFDIRPVRWKVHCSSDTSGFGCSGLKFSHEKSWWKGIIFNTQNTHRWERVMGLLSCLGKWLCWGQCSPQQTQARQDQDVEQLSIKELCFEWSWGALEL